MEHGVELGPDLSECNRVANVLLHKMISPSGSKLGGSGSQAAGQVVDADHLDAGVQQSIAQVGAQKTGTAGDENTR